MYLNLKFPIASLVVFSALASGCNSDGQLGANGLVRFSQVVDFKETDDFTSPIAVDKTMMLALQHPDDQDGDDLGLLDPDTYPELNLTVEPGTPLASGETFPLGFAQYGVVLDGTADYRLQAKNGEDELDYLEVSAKPLTNIRLATEATLTTSTDDCSSSDTVSPNNIVLHRNQTLTINVVPEDETGAAMLGLLHLSASSQELLALDAPLAGQGASANALQIRHKEDAILPENGAVTILEISDDLSIELELRYSNEDAELDCD
jgi:hypothetical protein